jgi:hypothetical protein
MRHAPPGHPVILTADESQRAILDAQARLARWHARLAARDAFRRARCRHLYDPATRRCRFCGAPHPERLSQ